MPFTKEELDTMRAADEEIEREFSITPEEIKKSRELDRIAVLDSYSSQKKKIAERRKAYREANREKIAESQRAYREANREKIAESQRAYREANREKYNAYMREYQRKRREKQC